MRRAAVTDRTTLLEDIDLELMRANPKPFFAYSDLTAVQTWLLDMVGLPAFHGPMVAADFYREGGVHESSFEAALNGGVVEAGSAEGLRILKPGRVEGTVYGGCLSILSRVAGHALCAADRRASCCSSKMWARSLTRSTECCGR